ncbi:MAG: hypothetical protein AAB922_07830 [Patescibacteria group bacterium]
MNEKLFIESEGLKVEVKVLGERSVYGRDEVEVSPVAGSGAKWVTKEKILTGVNKKLIKHD